MFSFFCLDFALFYQVLAKFFNEENFQAISNVQYAYCVCTTTTWLSSAIFNQWELPCPGVIFMFDTKDVAILLKYLIDTRMKIL